jgi:hypothetical protein
MLVSGIGWVWVWLATWWPPSIAAATRCGYAAACRPITQNVALMSRRASRARIDGVHCGSGPSSMVSAMFVPEQGR